MEIRSAVEIEFVKKGARAKSPVEYGVEVEKICQEKGYTFNGFVMPWNGIYTRVSLTCNHDKNEWAVSMNNFLRGTGCTVCGVRQTKQKQLLSVEAAVEQMNVALTASSVTFSRFDGEWQGTNKTKVILNCHKHGDFNGGLFFNVKRKGAKCPVCHTSGRAVTEAHARMRVIEKCKEYNYEFLGWVGEYKGVYGLYLRLKCLAHGVVWDTTEYTSFVNGSARGCSACADYGYRQHRPGYIYIQKLTGVDFGAIKFGITNRNPELRMKEHAKHSKLKHEMIFNWYFEDGRKAFDIEREIKNRWQCKTKAVKKELMEDGYTETLPAEILPSFLKEVKTLCNFA